MNQFNCYGNISSLDVKQAGETKVVNFNVAVNSKGKDGEEIVAFVPFAAFGKLADPIEKFFSVGDPIIIKNAEYRTRNYEKDGQKIYRHQFVVTLGGWEFAGMTKKLKEKKESEKQEEKKDVDITDVPF